MAKNRKKPILEKNVPKTAFASFIRSLPQLPGGRESAGRLRRRMAVALDCASGLVSFAKGSQNVGVNLTMPMSKKSILQGFDTS